MRRASREGGSKSAWQGRLQAVEGFASNTPPPREVRAPVFTSLYLSLSPLQRDFPCKPNYPGADIGRRLKWGFAYGRGRLPTDGSRIRQTGAPGAPARHGDAWRARSA